MTKFKIFINQELLEDPNPYMKTEPLFEINLGKNSIVGTMAFGVTVGIGFKKEIDGNTNLSYTNSVEKIYNHIKVNKKGVSEKACLEAISLAKQLAEFYISKLDDDVKRNITYCFV